MAAPAAAFAAGTVLKVGSKIQQGRIAAAQARAERRLAARNTVILEQDARAREQKARFDQLRQVRAAGRVKGRLRAQLGASGARLDVGAPLQLMAEQAAELELDNLLIGIEASNEAARLRDQAAMVTLQGQIARQRGKQAKRAALVSAGSSLLQDFGTARSQGFLGGSSGRTVKRSDFARGRTVMFGNKAIRRS